MNNLIPHEIIDRFTMAMRENGIETDASIVGDGQRHRVRVTGDKSGTENGWYVLHLDGVPAGAFGCWKRDVLATWCAKEQGQISDAERRELSARIERHKREQEAERQKIQATCKTKAEKLWNEARDSVAADHAYLVAKGVNPYGLKQLKDALLVPVCDADGTLLSLQFIQANGKKTFLSGTPKAGNYHRFGKNTERVLICEGFATGASLHEATGYSVAVAFDCGNLLAAAQAIRAKLPDAVLVLCADDDRSNPHNPGMSKARVAALAVGGLLAVPAFPADDAGTDFNDMHQHQGSEAVAAAVASAGAPKAEIAPAPEAESQEDLIKRLAGISNLAYFQVQKASAEALGITTGNLDKLRNAELKKQAAAADSEEGGSSVLFQEVEPWPELVNGTALLDELSATVRRFVVCERHTADAAALWLAFTWFIDAVSVAPIANITAPQPNCGKSTMLDLFERLTYKPLKCDGISPAALFRSVEKWRPTLLIDEVDAFLKDNEDARGILNSGHKRNGFIIRVVGDAFEPKKFSTWGAKALCGIGSVAPTLQSRSVRLELRRKLPGESVENLRHVDSTLIDRLQRQLARFAEDAHSAVKDARPAFVPGLSNRTQDNWEPLLAIADAAGGDWPDRARRTALAIVGIEAATDAQDANTELLTDIRAAFESAKTDKMFTTDLLAALCKDEEAPWATWNRGKPLSARQLSVRLGEFGVRPDDVRIGVQVRKGYTLGKFRDVFSRYLPSPLIAAATTLQPCNGEAYSPLPIRYTMENVADVKPLKPTDGKGCSAVADSTWVNGLSNENAVHHTPDATWDEVTI